MVATAIESLLADSASQQVIESTMQNQFATEQIDGILVISRDISERKEQERTVRELAEEYKTLLDNVADSIFFLSVEVTDSGNEEFRFERLNAAYEEQTGLTTDEVRGKTPTDVFGDELGNQLQANYTRCVRAREPITYQEEVPVETGARFWQTNLAPVVNGAVTRIIGITRNVTEQVKRERQLESQKEQLDEFASVVSHGLRNPLTGAQLRTELLGRECETEHIDAVERALDRMEDRIADTLLLARQGHAVSDPEPIDVSELLDTCWTTVPTGEAALEIADEMTINGDGDRLQHVFETLFRNSVEHGGTGFGLTIVRRIAKAHGWQVDVVEGSDGGARFEFTGMALGDS